ncbi:D-Ala-D-Ala carboxypeptidase family metallohydrolase [Priestia aryabhattai]
MAGTVRELRAVFTATMSGMRAAIRGVQKDLQGIGKTTEKTVQQSNESLGEMRDTVSEVREEMDNLNDKNATKDLNKALKDTRKEFEDTRKRVKDLEENFEAMGETDAFKEIDKSLSLVQRGLNRTGRVSQKNLDQMEKELRNVHRILDSVGEVEAFDDIKKSLQESEKQFKQFKKAAEDAEFDRMFRHLPDHLKEFGKEMNTTRKSIRDVAQEGTRSLEDMADAAIKSGVAMEKITSVTKSGKSAIEIVQNLGDATKETQLAILGLNKDGTIKLSTEETTRRLQKFKGELEDSKRQLEALRDAGDFASYEAGMDVVQKKLDDVNRAMHAASVGGEEYMNMIGELGIHTSDAANQAAIALEATRDKFFQSIDQMNAKSNQSKKMMDILPEVSPIQKIDKFFLGIGNKLENMAKQGTAANIAIKMLGPTASMKDLQDRIALINQGLMRMNMVVLGMSIVFGGFTAGMVKISNAVDGRLVPAAKKFKETWLDALTPFAHTWTDFALMVINAGTKVGEFIQKINELSPSISSAAGMFMYLFTAFSLILSPMAIGIGYATGLRAAFTAVFMMVKPFALGLLRVAGMASVLSAAIIVVVGSFMKMWKASSDLRNAVTNAWNGIKDAISQALGYLIPSLKWLGKEITTALNSMIGGKGDTIKSFWQTLGDIMAKVINTVVNFLLPQFSNALQHIVGFIIGIAPQLATMVKSIVGFVKTLVSVITDGNSVIGKIFSVVWTVVVYLVQSAWNNIKNIVTSGIAIITNLFQFFTNILQGNWKAAFNNLWQIVKNIVILVWNYINLMMLGKVLGLFKSFFAGGLALFKSGWSSISTNVQYWLLLIREFISGIYTAILTRTKNNFNAMLSVVRTIWNGIKSVTETVFNGVKSFLSIIWNGIKTVVSNTVNAVINNVRQQWNNLSSMTTTVFNAVKSFLVSVWNGIKSVVTSVVSALVTNLRNNWNTAKANATNVFNAIKSFFISVWNGIKSVFTSVANAIINYVRGQWNSLKSTTTTIFNAVKSFLTTVWNGIKSVISKVALAIWNYVKSQWNALKTGTSNIFNAIKKFLSDVWNGIKNTVSKLANNIKDGVVNAWNSLKNHTTEMFNNIKSKVTSIFDDIVSAAKKLPGRIGDGIKAMADKVKSGVSAIGKKLAGGLETVVNAITQKGINVVLDKIGVDKKNQIPKLDIPGYKKGTGGHPEDGPAFVGDGGEEELVRLPNGNMFLSPNKTTLIPNMPKGTEVFNGKQTKSIIDAAVPKYETGNTTRTSAKKLEKSAEESAHKALHGTKKAAGKAKDVIGDVWSYVEDPKKLMTKVFDSLNLKMPDVGGMMGQVAKSGVSKIKNGAVDFIKQKMDEFMHSFGDDGDSSKPGPGSGYGGMRTYVEAWYNKVKDMFGPTHFMGGYANRDMVGGSSKSMHAYGRAFDIGGSGATMSKIAEYLRTTASNLQYVIYNHRISGPGKGKKWRPYGGGGKDPHTSHVHADFYPPAGEGGGGATGKGASAWRSQIIKAAKQMGESLSPSELNGIIAQIHRESKGNERITQDPRVNDINARTGNLAKGLLQYVPSTFRAYAMKGHSNIFSGYDQLLAFFNNTRWRKDLPYGRSGWGPKGSRKYKEGTGLLGHLGGDAIMGDGGKREPFLLPNGLLGLSPAISTFFADLPKGTVVWDSIQSFVNQMNNGASSILGSNMPAVDLSGISSVGSSATTNNATSYNGPLVNIEYHGTGSKADAKEFIDTVMPVVEKRLIKKIQTDSYKRGMKKG